MHTHFSAVAVLGAFLAVLVVGTAWRLGAYRLVATDSPLAVTTGKAMLFQY
jgi:hypothetical protein